LLHLAMHDSTNFQLMRRRDAFVLFAVLSMSFLQIRRQMPCHKARHYVLYEPHCTLNVPNVQATASFAETDGLQSLAFLKKLVLVYLIVPDLQKCSHLFDVAKST